jgi:photosystem II stability/assembly factor-like uncharacterized protein
LYHSTDEGDSWENLDIPVESIWEIAGSEDELLVGTYPSALYVSNDSGETWKRRTDFGEISTRQKWRCIGGEDGRVRGIAVDPENSSRIAVGIEAGGLFISEDGGESWITNPTLPDDIHQILALDKKTFVVVCGRLDIDNKNHAAGEGGIYLTQNAGDNWERIDDTIDPSYFREVFIDGDLLYAGGSLTIPPVWHSNGNAHASLYRSNDRGETFEQQAYPGEPEELILSWTTHEDSVIAGTTRGRILAQDEDSKWTTVGSVSGEVHSLATVRD